MPAPQWTIRQATMADADALSVIGSATFLETMSEILAGKAIVSHCLKAHSANAYRNIISKGGYVSLVETT